MALTLFEIIAMCSVATLWNILLFVVMVRGKRAKPKMKGEPLSICFVHPDLGLGGAEMLVVETAMGLKERGHHVEIFTSYHDPKRAFTETVDGSLDVHVHDSLVPRSCFGRFHTPLAIIRFFWTSAKAMMRHKNLQGGYDIILVDQISSTIPLLKYSGAKVVFYCHYPDMLLAGRRGLIKRLYRIPLDFLEGLTTGLADTVLVNSHYTQSVFKNTFKRIHTLPAVLYPTVQAERISSGSPNRPSLSPPTASQSGTTIVTELTVPEYFSDLRDTRFVLSLNRFERKKNHGLAIEALALLLPKIADPKERERMRLVVAGGYDPRVAENVEHLEELKAHAKRIGVADHVHFYARVPDVERNWLLWNCKVVLYTPENEHFGIVPLEAGVALRPVIACNSGGPLESIIDGVTGYHCPPDPDLWADKIYELINNEALCKQLGEAAVKRVISNFSPNAILPQLEDVLYEVNYEPTQTL